MGVFDGLGDVSSSIPTTVFTGGANPVSVVTGFVPQMILGSFMFSINSAAYQEWRRSNLYRWQSQDVIGEHEVLQYCGPGSETIILPGVIYPMFRGGTGQLEKIRALAAMGEPQMLITATGGVLGQFVIEQIEETHTTFAAFGIPRKIEFNITLRNYSAGVGFADLVSAITSLF